jgi:Delta3-Delta2-enoyl-CoA isomerase
MLQTIQHDSIIELRMDRPPVNALNPDLISALRRGVTAATDQGARALVLSGAPGMFSAGLDVPTLLGLDRTGLAAAWRDFFGLCAALACSPIPVVAAITGHSPAGGAVLSIYCDYRVMARGPYKIGLNEVQVGLFVPDSIQHALRRLIGIYRAERLLVAGAMIGPEQALQIGFVDELAEPDDVIPRAIAWVGELLKLPPQAMSATRRLCRADLIAAVSNPDALPIDDFVNGWFAEESQSVLRALVARLKGGK